MRTLKLGGIVFIIIWLQACAPIATVGINELDIEQLQQKLEDKESFILLTYAAIEEDVEKSHLLTSYDEIAKKKGATIFYCNFINATDEVLVAFGERFTHEGSNVGQWRPNEDGLGLVIEGAVLNDTGNLSVDTIVHADFMKASTYEIVSDDIQDVQDYIVLWHVPLTTQ